MTALCLDPPPECPYCGRPVTDDTWVEVYSKELLCSEPCARAYHQARAAQYAREHMLPFWDIPSVWLG